MRHVLQRLALVCAAIGGALVMTSASRADDPFRFGSRRPDRRLAEEAREKLEKLGLHFDIWDIRFDDKWKGADTDLELLEQVDEVRGVKFLKIDLSDGMVAILAALPALRQVELNACSLSVDQARRLLATPKLRSLTLTRMNRHPALFSFLREGSHVKELHVLACDVSRRTADQIGAATQLTMLWLDHVSLVDTDLSFVGKLENLERLILEGPSIRDRDLADLENLRQLRSLRIVDTDVRGPGLAFLNKIASLEDLDLSRHPIRDEHLANVRGLINLQQLNLGRTQITDDGLTHLAGMEKLKSLYFWHTNITGRGFRHWPKWHLAPEPPLTDAELEDARPRARVVREDEPPPPVYLSLHLGGTHFNDEGLKEVAYIARNVVELDVQSTHIRGDGLAHLERMRFLHRLSLSDCPIGDESLHHLARARALARLDLSHTLIGDAGLAALSRCRALSSLWIRETQVSDTGLEGWTPPKYLDDVFAYGPKMSSRGVDSLKQRLPGRRY